MVSFKNVRCEKRPFIAIFGIIFFAGLVALYLQHDLVTTLTSSHIDHIYSHLLRQTHTNVSGGLRQIHPTISRVQRPHLERQPVSADLILVVLFTTFKVNEGAGRVENTLEEWASLSPPLHPVLYSTNDVGVQRARRLGWTVVPCPRKDDAISPSCVLPAMFLDAQKRFPTARFYGYANGDVLFDQTLLTTLSHVEKSLLVYPALLVTGCRFNYQMSQNESIVTAMNVTSRRKKSSQFTGWAIDYFITPNGKYNWSAIPPVVVGRTLYDNFMISHSIGHNVTVVDATKTIFAMHQTNTDNYESRKGKKDYGINNKVLRKNTFSFDTGRVGCARLVARLGRNNTVEFVKSDQCKKKKKRSGEQENKFHTDNSELELNK